MGTSKHKMTFVSVLIAVETQLPEKLVMIMYNSLDVTRL